MKEIKHHGIEEGRDELTEKILKTLEPYMDVIHNQSLIHTYHSNAERTAYYETLITWITIAWLNKSFTTSIEELQIDVEYDWGGKHVEIHRIIKEGKDIEGYMFMDNKILQPIEYEALTSNKPILEHLVSLSEYNKSDIDYYFATIIVYLVYLLAHTLLADFRITIIYSDGTEHEVIMIR